jgi:hypothetical protein
MKELSEESEIAILVLLARAVQWPEALDWLAVAPLARTQSERR